MIFKFSLKYLFLSLVIFCVEVIIATLLKDVYFIRAFVGDVLVVVLLYTFFRTFIEPKSEGALLIFIFGFAVLIETLQYFKLAESLGFEKNSFAYIVLGNYFSWGDILCYAVGCFLVYLFVNKKERR